MAKPALALALLCVTAACTANEPPLPPKAALLITEEAEVEVLGLRHWTLEMLQDSIAKYAPEDGLASHACAAVLRYELGFADASVSISRRQDGLRRVDIAVVEPQDSGWIRYPEPASDSFPDRLEWQAGLDVFLRHSGEFQSSLQIYALVDETPPDLPEEFLSEAGNRLADFLRSRTPDDLELALRTLDHDRNWHNRVIAYAILGRFPSDDRSWYALVDGLLDVNGPGSSTAQQTLGVLTRTAARRVDWREKAGSLRWLVNGTNLFGHTPLLRALTATEIDPSLASQVLQDGGGITPYKLVSTNETIRSSTADFLRQISGKDFGNDSLAWMTWIASVS